jgi:hypothetical protein
MDELNLVPWPNVHAPVDVEPMSLPIMTERGRPAKHVMPTVGQRFGEIAVAKTSLRTVQR